MTQANTRESGFEQLIERALVGSTIEERRNEGIPLTAEFADRQTPGDKFYWGRPDDFKINEAVDSRRLWSRGHTTRPSRPMARSRRYARAHRKRAETQNRDYRLA